MAKQVSQLAPRLATALQLLLSSWGLAGCLVDADHRCGAHQVLEDGACSCELGYGLTLNTCLACESNEVGSAAGCECAPGFGRVDATMPCTPTASLGQPCGTDRDCEDPAYSFCASGSPENYCTIPDCSSSAECSNDYSCNPRADRSFCERPPVGAGVQCESNADCAGFEAAYCEVVLAGVCLKSECKADPNTCPGDWVCCDVPLISESLCLPPGELMSGQCPAGGSLVPRPN